MTMGHELGLASAQAQQDGIRWGDGKEPVSALRRWRGVVSPWICVDPLVWVVAVVIALFLRFDFDLGKVVDAATSGRFLIVFAVLTAVQVVVGWVSGLYRGWFIRSTSAEMTAIASIVVAGGLVGMVLTVALGRSDQLPVSVVAAAVAFSFLGMLGLRYVVRYARLVRARESDDREPVIVFGAGSAGTQLVQQINRSEHSPYRVVGLLDDDALKKSLRVYGTRVTGSRADLEATVRRVACSTLVVAIPSLTQDQLLEVRSAAERFGMRVLVLPPLADRMHGRVQVNELREIDVHDLLGRAPVNLNLTAIADALRDRRVLVTGAGGSIGSELCRQISRFNPAELMMLDRDESALHAVQLSIHGRSLLDGRDTILADIRDEENLLALFRERKPDLVLHAAALKHLPLLETYPLEALKTNVIGTCNVLKASMAAGVEVFVNVSTDKAANPTSILGESKRITERLTASAALNAEGRYVSVRFGNVLGSRGSVLTAFEEQISVGGPVTVTHPDVSRFFMTIPEACQLVLQSAVVAKSGETTVLDMGEPIKIVDIARTLIARSPDPSVKIVFTGLRAGEKLAEDLFDAREARAEGTRHPLLSHVAVTPLDADEVDRCPIVDHQQAAEWLRDTANPDGDSPRILARAMTH